MKIPETFRIKCSLCVHRAFTIHIALAFALRSCSAFAHRSAFTYRSPTCVQRSDILHSAFAQRSFSVRSPFTHRSLIVRSPLKWESRTFQVLYQMMEIFCNHFATIWMQPFTSNGDGSKFWSGTKSHKQTNKQTNTIYTV